MGFRASAYRVMIASPGDVQPERDFIERVIVAWNDEHSEERGVVFLPVRWERASPRQGAPGQDVVNEDLVDISDVLIGVFWQSVGRPTRTSPSGSVEEVRRFSAAGKLHCVLFKRPPDPPPDTDQFRALQAFKQEVHAHEGDLVGLSRTFADDAQLQAIVHRYLSDTLAHLPEVAGDAGLTLDQQRVLTAITRRAFADDFALVNTGKLGDSEIEGFSRGRFQASLEELARRGFLSIERSLGNLGFDVQLTAEGIRQGTPDLAQAEQRVQAAICRMAPTTDEDIANEQGLPVLLVQTIARRFADNGLVNVLSVSECMKIRRPTSQLCNWDKIRPRKACVVIGPHFPNKGDTHQQSFEVDLLNEGEHEAREIKVVSDVTGSFPDEPREALPFVIPPMTSVPSRRYRAGFALPWPEHDDQGEPIRSQQKEVRLKMTFRDGLDERDTAIFTLLLRNNQTPNRWSAEELRHKAELSPICQGSRMESR
jgi:hypothetical protein